MEKVSCSWFLSVYFNVSLTLLLMEIETSHLEYQLARTLCEIKVPASRILIFANNAFK